MEAACVAVLLLLLLLLLLLFPLLLLPLLLLLLPLLLLPPPPPLLLLLELQPVPVCPHLCCLRCSLVLHQQCEPPAGWPGLKQSAACPQ
jgi:hypothetical protein